MTDETRPCDHPGCRSHVTHPCEKCGTQRGVEMTPADLAALDECMAVEAMEWTIDKNTDGLHLFYSGWAHGPVLTCDWHPATDIAQAIMCLNKWRTREGSGWSRRWRSYQADMADVSIELYYGKNGWLGEHHAPTLQLAICKALEKMKEKEG